MNARILSAQQRIDNLHAKAKTDPVSADSELQAQLARFLCILSSGLIEQAVILTLEDYTARIGHRRLHRFVSAALARFHNGKFEDILNMLGRFDPTWRKEFEARTQLEVKDAIDSIVNNRNQIAHGAQTNISLIAFSEYYRRVKLFINDFHLFISSN